MQLKSLSYKFSHIKQIQFQADARQHASLSGRPKKEGSKILFMYHLLTQNQFSSNRLLDNTLRFKATQKGVQLNLLSYKFSHIQLIQLQTNDIQYTSL